MTPTELNHVLERTLRHAVVDGELPSSATETPTRVTLRRPPHGEADFASNLALRLAPATGHPALDIAEVLRTRLAQEAGISRVEVAGPGFLNITLRESAQAALLRQLIAGGADTQATVNGPRIHPGSLPEDPARDAARWSALTGQPISYERRDSQPLFRVQYARARSHALVTGAHALGFRAEPGSYRARCEVALLALLADTSRLRHQLRDGVRDSAEHGVRDSGTPDADTVPDPTRRGSPEGARARGRDVTLARHLQSVADAFLAFTSAPDARSVLPQGDEKPEAAHRSRLALAEATGVVLAGGLTQLGISAPHYL